MKYIFNRLIQYTLIFTLVFVAACGSKKTEEPPLPATELVERAPVVEDIVKKAPRVNNRLSLLKQYYRQLKDLDVDYKKVGNIMEELAKIQLVDVYDAENYEILNGIEYQTDPGRTAGELDLVILNRKTKRATVVGEIKLSNNLSRAGKTANKQIKRFRDNLESDNISKFIYLGDRSRTFTAKNFKGVKTYWRVGNSGAKAAGFDFEVDLRRGEADLLQEKLLKYKGVTSNKSATASSAQPSADKPYIGNKKSKGKAVHYYKAKHLPGEKKRVYFSTLKEAKAAGFKPHDCIPKK